MNKTKGFLCVIISAFIFGFTPILCKLTYSGGSNAIMLVFLRNSMSLPIMYAILKYKKVSLKINREEFKKLFILSIFSTILTALLLYIAYDFVSVGMATTVHYVYPILVALVLAIFFKERITKIQVFSLTISFIGVLLFFDGGSSLNFAGLFIAFASGISYGMSLIYMDKSGLKDYHPLLVTFYTCFFASIVLFLVNIISSNFTLSLTPSAWIYSFIVSVLTSVIGISFMQIGVRNIGPTTTSILCMFEPITSVIMGIILLNESISFKNILACILILIAVLILSIFREKNKDSQQLDKKYND
jgi:drug/metabolite transporter (DMT)-like permease